MPYRPPTAAAVSVRKNVPVWNEYLPAGGTVHVVTTADILALITLAAGSTAAIVELEIVPDSGNTGDISIAWTDGSTFVLPNGALSQSFSSTGLQPADLTDFIITGVDGDGFQITIMASVTAQ